MARKMKDSGIEWIKSIPENWECKRGKQLFIETNERSIAGTEELLTVSHITGVTPRRQKNVNMFMSESLTGYKICHPGDIAANTMWLWQGAVGISNYHGVISPSYNTYRQRTNDYDSKYLDYLLRIQPLIDTYAAYSTGITLSRLRLYPESFLSIYFIVPPLTEQQHISSYLDVHCSEIDAMLFKTRSSIEEYKKLKQAVITQAVTKGVRGERKMKDSGIEWIGEIPKEWRKTQLRHCATIKSGITLGKSYSKDTILIERPYLRVANVQGGYVDLNDLATIEVTPDEDLKYRLHSGDVLMTEGGDRDKLGRGCVWHGEIEPCLHQNHVFAVQTNDAVLLPEFLEYLTASDVGRSYFDVTAIKTTNLACTSSSKVLAFTIPLPPVEEQIEIVGFIKKRSLELNKLIMKKELLVQELERYKKSLIYEVVTGKREV